MLLELSEADVKLIIKTLDSTKRAYTRRHSKVTKTATLLEFVQNKLIKQLKMHKTASKDYDLVESPSLKRSDFNSDKEYLAALLFSRNKQLKFNF